jgi:hypothetical protein
MPNNCTDCGVSLSGDRGFVRILEGANFVLVPAGPPRMREKCPKCWDSYCSGCGLPLGEVHRAVALPTGRRHYCGDCWPAYEAACWELAAEIMRRREVEKRVKHVL